MTNSSFTSDSSRCLRIGLDWRWHRTKPRSGRPRGEPREEDRPLRCETAGSSVSAPANELPFADAQFDVVDCDSIFAYVRNDEGLANELSRITAVGGSVLIRVPAKGPLAVLDAFNLHRYLVDISKRGLRPFETADIGWRRHYSEGDLALMFGPRDFTLTSVRRSGLGASEAMRLSGFVLFRWLRPSRDGYMRLSRAAERVRKAEAQVAWRHGFWLEVELRKHESATRNVSGSR
jgi:SAM-dependent methyltransferase